MIVLVLRMLIQEHSSSKALRAKKSLFLAFAARSSLAEQLLVSTILSKLLTCSAIYFRKSCLNGFPDLWCGFIFKAIVLFAISLGLFFLCQVIDPFATFG